MSSSDFGLQRLARAFELLRTHRAAPACSDEDFLLAHGELRELLEPLLAEGDGDEPPSSPAQVTLGDYRLLRELGRGGMGVVYEAMQRSLGRPVALKVLPDHRAASPTALARFHREAELLARMQHEHLVPVFASGEQDGRHFFAMELVDGCSLAKVLRTFSGREPGSLAGDALATALGGELGDTAAGRAIAGRSHVDAVLNCLVPIAAALAHAHAHGVVHRDVKPANILLRRDGTPLLSDFGLARDLEAPGLTHTGDFAGTPHYMAPEQIEAGSESVDGRVDVFALGATLYELLTLRRAFDGASTEAVIANVLRGEPESLRRLGLRLPDDLLAVLDKALTKSPADRYRTMAAFAADLRALRELRPVSVRRPGLPTRLRRYARREPLRATLAIVLAVGLPTLLCLGGYLLWQQPRIEAAAAQERRAAVEALLEGGYLELGEGNPRLAIEQFTAAARLLPDLPETAVGLVLAHERIGDGAAARAARERLAGENEDVRRELLGLRADGEATLAEGSAPRPPAAAAPPTSDLVAYVRGMRWLAFAHDSGDQQAYRCAAAALREAIDRAPVARSLYHCQYLHALMHLAQPEPIRAFVRVVEDLWPDSPIVWYWMGFALEHVDPERAMRLQQRVLVARPDLVLPHASIARLHEQQGDLGQAIQCYRTMLANVPGEVNALIGLARTLLNAGELVEALALAEQAIAAAPFSHMPRVARAGALLGLGKPDEALESAERAAQLTPSDPECHLMLAKVRLARGEHDEAVAATDEAAKLAPDDAAPHVLAGIVFMRLGRAADAARSLERAVARQPEQALVWFDLAVQRQAIGDPDGADAAVQQAVRHGQDEPEVHALVGNWYRTHGDVGAAAAHLLRSIELDPEAGPARVHLAAIRWRQGDMTECIRLYREALVASPDLEPASEGLARALALEARHDESIAERRRWAEAHPDDVIAWLKLASNLLLCEPTVDLDAAHAAVERARALDPEPRADVTFWRAEVLHARGAAQAEWRGLYERARAMPDCSQDLRERIRRRLQADDEREHGRR